MAGQGVQEGPGRGRALAVLRDRSFLVLALEFALVTVAEWTFTTALAIRAYDVGGALAVGLAGARFLPAALAGVPLGGLGDRFSPGWVLAGTAAGRAVMMAAALGAVADGARFGVLLALAVVDAMIGTAYRPAQARLIPALARTPGDVAGAAALFANTKTVSQVLGALLGGALLASSGVEQAVLAAGGLYLVAALSNAALAGRLHARAAAGSAGPAGEAGDWLAGVRTLTRTTHIANVAGLAALRSLGRGLWLALATLAALGFLGLGQGGVGLLMALSGLGVLIAIPLSALLVARPRLRGPLTLALACCGMPLLLIAVVAEPGPAFAAVIVWGFGMAFADVILSALQFRVVDAPVLSRTTGAIESVKIGAEGAGALLAPVLVAVLGLRGAIALAGLGPLVTVAARQGPLARVDAIAATRVRLLQLLRGVPLFAGLGVEALERLGAGTRAERHAAGRSVVVEGDREALDFYVIEAGRAEVRLADWRVALLGPGDAFGERALLRDAPRAATVRALDDLEVQAIDRETFLSALIGTSSEARLSRPRDADTAALVETLRSLPMLSTLQDDRLNELVAAGDLRSARAGEAIIREGDPGDELFVLLRGSARVERSGRTVVELLPGDHFGEIALLHDVPRSATVRAATDSLLLAIGRAAYRGAAGPQPASA